MLSKEFELKISEMSSEVSKMLIAGGKEYSDMDVLSHFKIGSRELGITKYQILLVFARKHWLGIVRYALNPTTKQRDSLKGRIADLIAYLILLYAMHEEDLGSQNSTD